MIRSEVHRGLIYAGETPLACTIAVEQTGPMVLTIRAGSLTTTGEAVIRPYEPARHEVMTTGSAVIGSTRSIDSVKVADFSMGSPSSS